MVQEYLSSIGKAPLLTRDEEVEIARRLEEGRLRERQAVIGSRVAINELARLGRRLREGKIPLKDVIQNVQNHEPVPGEQPQAAHVLAEIARVRRLDQRNARLVEGLEHRGTSAARRCAIEKRIERNRRDLLILLDALGISREQIDGIRRKLLDLGDRLENAEALHRVTITHRQQRIRQARRVVRQEMEEAGVSAKELRHTCREIRAGEQAARRARDELVLANRCLVVGIAKRYTGFGLQLMDLIQEGNIGLMTAADRFDHRLGYKLSTYAVHWIKQSMSRAIANQARTVRLPVQRTVMLSRLNTIRRRLIQRLGREPDIEALAREMEISPKRIHALLLAAWEPVSLETPVGQEDGCLGDMVADTRAVDPLEALITKRLTEHTRGALSTLSPREEKILRMRFGIGGKSETTLREIGQGMDLSRERIRQIESRALGKLRHHLGI